MVAQRRVLSRSKEEEESVAMDLSRIPSMPVDVAVRLAFQHPPEIGAFIVGPPGIGKTQLTIKYAHVEARRLGKEPVFLNALRRDLPRGEYLNLVKSILRNPEKYYVIAFISFGATHPEDLVGVPTIVEVRDGDEVLAAFHETLLNEVMVLLSYRDIHGCFIIDDALDAPDDLRRAFIKAIFNERKIGGTSGRELSKNVRVIATGNLTTESELAVPIPKTMVGRCWFVHATPASLESWLREMDERYGNRWDKRVYAFLKRYTGFYCDHSKIGELIPSGPVPRSWTALAVCLHRVRDVVDEWLRNNVDLLIAYVYGFVGYEAATQFVAFLKKPVISVDEAVADPRKVEVLAGDLDAAYRFGVELAMRLESAALKNRDDEVFAYLRVLDTLMRVTSDDVGMMVLDVVSREARKNIKLLLRKSLASESEERRVLAERFVGLFIDEALSELLF